MPLIVKGPGLKAGTTTGEVACSTDFFPTLIEATGANAPDGDGVSLLRVFGGEKLKARALFWHYPHYANQGSRPGGAVRRGDYKLIEFYEDGRRELFDIKKDISESRNLSAEKPGVVAELAAELDVWRRSVGAKMPTPNPDYAPNPQAKDGTITLPARTAAVTGVMLRYEPLPHKNTLGYWVNKDDQASFEFTVGKPGKFIVEVLQGCGKGSGGAEVAVWVTASVPKGDLPPLKDSLTFTVKDTGGFQAFEARDIGTVTIDKPGRYELWVVPKTKPGTAVMDLRQVVLKPAK